MEERGKASDASIVGAGGAGGGRAREGGREGGRGAKLWRLPRPTRTGARASTGRAGSDGGGGGRRGGHGGGSDGRVLPRRPTGGQVRAVSQRRTAKMVVPAKVELSSSPAMRVAAAHARRSSAVQVKGPCVTEEIDLKSLTFYQSCESSSSASDGCS